MTNWKDTVISNLAPAVLAHLELPMGQAIAIEQAEITWNIAFKEVIEFIEKRRNACRLNSEQVNCRLCLSELLEVLRGKHKLEQGQQSKANYHLTCEQMAQPIGATPILAGKDATRFINRICRDAKKPVGLIPTPKLAEARKLINKHNGQEPIPIKESGYVQLSKDQTLPEGVGECMDCTDSNKMLKAGWRKVKSEVIKCPR